jgi:hypothetical protein
MLHDCVNVDDTTVNNTDYVQDYKKLKKRQMTPSKSKEKLKDQPSAAGVARKLKDGMVDVPVENEWKVIASERSIEKGKVCTVLHTFPPKWPLALAPFSHPLDSLRTEFFFRKIQEMDFPQKKKLMVPSENAPQEWSCVSRLRQFKFVLGIFCVPTLVTEVAISP